MLAPKVGDLTLTFQPHRIEELIPAKLSLTSLCAMAHMCSLPLKNKEIFTKTCLTLLCFTFGSLIHLK